MNIHEYSDLREFYVSRITKNGTIWIFVPCIIDQLLVPYSVIVFSISALRKYCYRGSEKLCINTNICIYILYISMPGSFLNNF